MQLFDKTSLGGKRERAPAQGVNDADISAQSLGEAHGGVAKDALGIGEGRRERAPAKGAPDSDNPPTLLEACVGRDDADTSETLTGKCERAPVEEVMGSDALTQSAGKE